LNDGTGFQVFKEGPQDTLQIYPAVLIKTRIFGRDEGFHQHGRNLLQGNHQTAFFVEFGYFLSVMGINGRDRGWSVIGQGGNLGQIFD